MKKIIVTVIFWQLLLANLMAQNYTIIVDRSKSLGDLVVAGKYDIVYGEINSENFPIDNPEKRINTLVVHLFKNTNHYSGEKICKELKKIGYRPADIRELLAFGITYPEKQSDSSIIALGSRYPDKIFSNSYFIPVLGGENNKRIIYTEWMDVPRNESFIFMAIKIE